MQINKVIFYTIFEATSLFIVIFSSYFIWGKFEDKTKEFAYNNSQELTLQIENRIKTLTRTKDSMGINENNKIIMEINNTGKLKKQYYIYIKVNKNNNLDTKYIKTSLNEEKKYMYQLENYIENDEKYYIIEKGIINGKDKIIKNLYLWLTEETPTFEEEKSYNFEINVEQM